MNLEQGQCRAVIESVQPEIDCGRFPIKRVVGESVVVEADVFTDGHDAVVAVVLFQQAGESEWHETPMTPLENDRWRGEFTVTQLGQARYTLLAWTDRFLSWVRDLHKRAQAGQADIAVNLLMGAQLVESAAERASGPAADWLSQRAAYLASSEAEANRIHAALDPELTERMRQYPDRSLATRYVRELTVVVDPPRARFSSWYELFPRSCSTQPGRHGTFRDVEARLPRIAAMGFDVLYLPPIHPIGVTHRKGKNNSPTCQEGDPGSPWGIGGAAGGHTAIHPELGTLEDFRRLLCGARAQGIEIALDIAYQCSPDHPWVREHPEWFRRRPDGTIQYAENPPKKYQDIYPIDFESSDWRALWQALAGVVRFWVEQGVSIFRVDNPHTKAFPFWEWMIGEVKRQHPEVLFLSEAFTRPRVMYRLAKLGFTQSYTYFTWRNTRDELIQYFTELTRTQVREYLRPNLWPNTPDILPEFLQWSGRPGFIIRLVLAATLGASYGVYGPAFELCESRPTAPGKEEYLDSEKYEIRVWDLDAPESIEDIITRVNRIRKQNPALHSDRSLYFHPTDNPQLLCYSKRDPASENTLVIVVNLDPYHTQSGWIDLNLDELGLKLPEQYQVHDLLGEGHFIWQGPRNFISLDPSLVPAHIFRVRHRVRTEHNFEYYL